ncbi:MAG: DNA-binding response regulator [Rhodospirillaceae bacterium]|nr:MAG: DNA-binding response regulator [Rhodospirillaceae bacterium]
MRILLVEDSLAIAEYVCACLVDDDYIVDTVGTLADAEAALATTTFDVVILDLGLPDGDGLDMLKSMRAAGNKVPVLVLSARDELDERVKGLNTGADDYMPKPFAVEELKARLRALLRRPETILETVLKAGNVALDSNAREVSVNRKIIKISKREMGVLEQLMRRFEHVVSKETLESKLYGFGETVTANSLEANVSRLRKRLSQSEASIVISTLRGVGYVLSLKDEI